jgi:F-type H+-transporting ATPase subunit delta
VRSSSVTRRYAKALFELVEDSAAESARSSLSHLSQTIETNASLRHLLASPVFSIEEKLAVLSALADRLGSPPILNRFLAQLIKRNRTVLLPEIAQAFAALLDEAEGKRRVQVSSAKPLGKDEETRIRGRLKELLRREVDIEFVTVPSLLSGLQISIGSTVYDSSARTRLTAMHSLLTKES